MLSLNAASITSHLCCALRRRAAAGEPADESQRAGFTPALPFAFDERLRSVVAVRRQHCAVAGVYLDVVVADIDVEDERAVVVLEVDFTQGARGGTLRGRDGGVDGDAGLRQQVLAVVELAGTGRVVGGLAVVRTVLDRGAGRVVRGLAIVRAVLDRDAVVGGLAVVRTVLDGGRP